MLPDKIAKLKESTVSRFRSKKGKDVLLYLLFLCVATVFWFILSLDSTTEKDYEIPVEFVNIPEKVTILSNVPNNVFVTVKGNGYQLLKNKINDSKSLKLDFQSYITGSGSFSISKEKLIGQLRTYFGHDIEIVTVKPDSLYFSFTTKAGREVPIQIICNANADYQYMISDKITANVDSVKLFGKNELIDSIINVETEPIYLSGLKENKTIEVGIKPIDGVKIIPDKITVTIPVETMISKRKSIPVDIIGVGNNVRLITFPSNVEVSYLVPMSKYNDDYPIKTFVDYNTIDTLNPKVRVQVSSVPDYYLNVKVNPENVEYLIDRHN